ncbi:phage antirepressor KilAC domain-containing protein [Enterocloster bolteae]|uniref:phage antirepressor KilAC domain-containing protein n=1 Tax=Enterocloster bolteae TaxID=208479 RepID=UPI002A84081F|nr:phage antirepressor KilAC domain-containing protein [Enterocloster bolteae]
MEEIIKINYDAEQPTVSARELHRTLEIKERFSVWADRLLNYFGSDEMTSVLTPTEVQNNGGVQIRELQDYIVSVDTAKHICLMSRTEKGKQCRQYLIDLEKAWNTPEQVMARALKMAGKTIDKLKSQNTVLLEDVQRMKPKEIFADAVATSHTSILIGDLAKLIKQNGVDIGQKRLFSWLRDNGYLIKRNGSEWNMPTQRSMEAGLFEVKESTVNNPDGSVRINKTTKVTGKGQQYFINKFLRRENGRNQ